MKAKETFHAAPWCHNCAQAVAYRWRELYDDDAVVEKYAAYGGGRAPEGCCGALYAAMQADPEHAEEIRREFERQVGATRCREIKGKNLTPCPLCVDIADRILEDRAEMRAALRAMIKRSLGID